MTDMEGKGMKHIPKTVIKNEAGARTDSIDRIGECQIRLLEIFVLAALYQRIP
jgi:hypothetical protein